MGVVCRLEDFFFVYRDAVVTSTMTVTAAAAATTTTTTITPVAAGFISIVRRVDLTCLPS